MFSSWNCFNNDDVYGMCVLTTQPDIRVFRNVTIDGVVKKKIRVKDVLARP